MDLPLCNKWYIRHEFTKWEDTERYKKGEIELQKQERRCIFCNKLESQIIDVKLNY